MSGRPNLKLWGLIAIVFIAGSGAGWVAHSKTAVNQDPQSLSPYEFRSKSATSFQFPFINPLLECEEAEELFSELRPFKQELLALLEQLKADGLAKEISIYFRDLNNGPWTGINEKEDFQPASLSKVPLMIGVLKLAEKDPELLQKKILYDGPMDLHQKLPDGVGLETGKRYTIMEILHSLIAYSDNRSVWILDKLYTQKALRDPVFRELGIPSLEESPDMAISMKNYASFFRVLYNASYLNREMSDLALRILSESEMKDALVAGIPPSVPVAHKFGRMNLDPENPEMHDCGIIYYPGHPYLLCVMTKGDNTEKQTIAIREISAFVYKTLTTQLIDQGSRMRTESNQ